MATSTDELTDRQYEALLALRDGLRRFLRWSAERAEAVGITPAQHQLLLVVRAHRDPQGPTIGDVAAHLLLRHHSVVELVDRASSDGLVRRAPDPTDHRTVRLELTRRGRRCLAELSRPHLEELTRMRAAFRRLSDGLDPEAATGDASRSHLM